MRTCLLLWTTTLLLLLVDATKLGSVVETDVVLNRQAPVDALRTQMPLFGIPTTCTFVATESFGLQFAEGLWATPNFSVEKGANEHLQKVTVEFVYSNAIDAVYTRPVYDQIPREFVFVEYKWIREAKVDLQYGFGVMSCVVFLAGVFILCVSCGLLDDDDDSRDDNNKRSSTTTSAPKWD